MTDIILDTPGSVERIPVLKNARLGETCTIALAKAPEQRDILKQNDTTQILEPILKPNGKHKQELVITGVVVTSTMEAGIGENRSIPAPGDLVRKIVRGKSYMEWIDADKACRPRAVGDMITFTSTHAIVYDAQGKPSQELTDQASIDNVPRGRTMGVYGPLNLRKATDAEASWVKAAQDAYHKLNAAPEIALDPAPAAPAAPADDPFDTGF